MFDFIEMQKNFEKSIGKSSEKTCFGSSELTAHFEEIKNDNFTSKF